MTGVELIIGGRFASAVIGKLVNLGCSYLGDNYDLHSGTKKMLTNLAIQLPHIQSVIEAAEKQQITNNRGLATWLEQLKDAAYEAEDVMDDFEAKRIRKIIKGKGKISEIASSSAKMIKTLFSSDIELKKLESVVDKLDKLCMGDFINTLQSTHGDKGKEHLDNPGSDSETSSCLVPGVTIFGRDEEIKLILDMILNVVYGDFYQQALDDPDLQQGEGEESSSLSDKIFRTCLSWGIPGKLIFIRTVKKGDAPEQSKKSLLGLRESGKSMLSDTIKKDDNILTAITTMTQSDSISNHKLAVIPIVGLGGVGKTTVAKKIYNDGRVEEHFTLRAWVYVSENYDAKKIMQEMLCSFESHTYIDPMMSLENAGNKLKNIISNCRFLLILDNMNDRMKRIWSRLEEVLLYGVPGSVVVVTTQSKSIANTIGTLPEVTLDVLKPDLFWELFQYYAFGGLGNHPTLLPSKHDELKLKKVGKHIAEKLHGLPLAGKVIGTLLSTRLEREFWEDIRGSDWWNIEDVRENILPSIVVGYNYLDPELKQCFVFCSIFPKHYVFERETLVQMWIAHGFIQPGKEETNRLEKGEIRLEDIGRKWFDKLVNRSFFQPTLSDGKYIMHDVVHDLAIIVSSNEFCFVKSHDKHLPYLARHMGIDCDNLEVEWKCNESTRLRTVILFGNWTNCSAEFISNIVSKYNGLRLLDLSYIMLERNEPINAACQLSHLRFVDLSFTGIKSIPDEFCALCHLEVLDMRGCYLKKLPKGMNQLINLRHLYATSHAISLISGIGKLTKLQELEKFHIGEREGYRISELMDMNEISGHLLLSNLNNVPSKEEAAKSQLDKKMFLKSLELEYNTYGSRQVTIEILDALKPACSLEILKVTGCGSEPFPGWVFSPDNGFCNLKVIHVNYLRLSSLPAFGELASLEILSFDDLPLIEKVGSELYGSSDVVFPSLKELKFSRMSSWRDWSVAEAGETIFPCLMKLVLSECHLLCNIETVLKGMPNLAHLSITQICDSLTIYCTPLKFLEVMELTNIKQLQFVEGLAYLVCLRKLVIAGFEKIKQTYDKPGFGTYEISPREIDYQCLDSLTYLHLHHGYPSTQSLPRVGRLSSLRSLVIENSYAVEYTRDEESWFKQLISLEKLEFRKCFRLQGLPSQLHLLTSLKKLQINYCNRIVSLPEYGLPQNLAELYIENCPDLIHRCQPNQGDDWHKISHIPFVHFKLPDPHISSISPR
ncbi:putative disease resistance protein RGA4 [Carex rostrata]